MKHEKDDFERRVLDGLLERAWASRKNAFVLGSTMVGAAAQAEDGVVFVGCNVEHQFRSHDVHAEVNAISSMVVSGRTRLNAIAVVAERENFTPCGACLDWIFQFGGPSCLVVCQSRPKGKSWIFRAHDLMPHYPGDSRRAGRRGA